MKKSFINLLMFISVFLFESSSFAKEESKSSVDEFLKTSSWGFAENYNNLFCEKEYPLISTLEEDKCGSLNYTLFEDQEQSKNEEISFIK